VTGRRWRRLDPTDAYFAYDLERVLVGLEVPPLEMLRAALVAYAAANPAVLRVVDRQTSRWRPFTPGELATAPDDLITECHAGDPLTGMQALVASPPAGPNVRIVRGRGWVGVKTAHEALFDAASTNLLLGALLDPAPGAGKVRVSRPAARDAMLAGYLAGHPDAVRAAFAHRSRLGKAPRRPAPPLPADPPVNTHAHSDLGLPDRLRQLRAKHWPQASVSALVLAGIRAALSEAGIRVAPGAEVLCDVRRYFPGPRPLFGNWAVGVHLAAEDDLQPEAVTLAVREAVSCGLPVAAMAAGRVLGRRHRGTLLNRPVPEPVGQARLSFTYLGAYSDLRRLPCSPEGAAYVLSRTRPANAEALTVAVEELGGRFSVNVSHYDSVWPAAAVAAALDAFLHDPAGVISSAGVGRTAAREVAP
jgi:hypothetical protein